MSELPLCPECHAPLSGLGPVGSRHRGRRGAEPTNGYCVICHIGLTRTGDVWARSSGRR